MASVEQPALSVLTIGHSNHSINRFVDLLALHRIQVAVDTRSHPYSKHAPHFNREQFSAALSKSGIGYLYLGDQLGGRPPEDEYYDHAGHLLIDRVLKSRRFQQGITRLVYDIQKSRLAVVFTEENPVRCHRRRLITPALIGQRVGVGHIRGDGTVRSEAEIASELGPCTAQLALFTSSAFIRR